MNIRLALLLFALAALAQDVRPLTILHSNDLHAHLLPDDNGMGGLPTSPPPSVKSAPTAPPASI